MILLFGCTPENPTPNPTTAIPTITTTAVSSIYNNIASSGGTVISDGGGTVSAWGVCWSTSANPTLANSFLQNNEISGGFSSVLSGLTLNTTYYVRAYAINSAGTAYGNEVSFTTANNALLTIGQNYQGGKIAYIDATGIHGLIAAPSDESAPYGAPWGCNGIVIPGADGKVIGTGAQNTIDIMNGCSETVIAARLCGDKASGGYSDWYLPSLHELNQLYINRIAIGGFTSWNYWSSTEAYGSSTAAWHQNFYYGNYSANMGTNGRGVDYNVRAVRSF